MQVFHKIKRKAWNGLDFCFLSIFKLLFTIDDTALHIPLGRINQPFQKYLTDLQIGADENNFRFSLIDNAFNDSGALGSS